jgi:hypothetical protein
MTGRPTKIDAVVGHRQNGEPITVFDRVVEDIRAGCYTEDAAAHAGVHKETVYEWQRVGARAAALQSADRATKLSRYERRCIAFSDAVGQARAEWVVAANVLLEQLARGGLKVETETTKIYADGKIETTKKVETMLPDKAVLMWRLERTHDGYRRRVAVEGVEGGVPIPIEKRADDLADALEAFQAGVATAAAMAEDEREDVTDG